MALCVAAAIAYLTTLAPTITWRHWGIDTGEMALAADRWTVVHPSGYPLFLVLGKLFSWIPVGSLAYRTNLLSAAFAVLALAAAAWTLSMGLRRAGVQGPAHTAGVLGGAGLLAFSHTFWSQAIITEVYTLHAFLLIGTLALLLKWRETGAGRYLAAAAFTFGLGMANHVTIALLLPGAGFFYLAVACSRESLLAQPARLAGSSAAGGGLRGLGKQQALRTARRMAMDFAMVAPLAVLPLALYLLVLWRAQENIWPSLWDPDTLTRIVDHAAGGAFRGLITNFPREWVAQRSLALPRIVLGELGIAGFPLAMAGVWWMLHHDRPLLVFGAILSALAALFAVNYPVYDSQVYLLPLFISLMMAAGWGTAVVAGLCLTVLHGRSGGPASLHGSGRDDERPGNRSDLRRRLATVLILVAALLLPWSAYVVNRARVDLSDDWWAYTLMRNTLEQTPEGAILISGSPQEVLSLWYIQYGERIRDDVLVVDAFWAMLPSYQRNMRRHFPDRVPLPGAADYLKALVRLNQTVRPVYATPRAQTFLPDLRFTPAGTELMRIDQE